MRKHKKTADMEFCLYMRVVAFSASHAMQFIGSSATPVDLGPADLARYRPGARVWGFLSRPETPAEAARRIETVARGGTVGEGE